MYNILHLFLVSIESEINDASNIILLQVVCSVLNTNTVRLHRQMKASVIHSACSKSLFRRAVVIAERMHSDIAS